MAALLRQDQYRPITLANFEELPQAAKLPPSVRKAIRVVGSVLPFKTNLYVVERLIDWENYAQDPMFLLTFPQRDMLAPEDYARMDALLDSGADAWTVKRAADGIRRTLNPHPAGQRQHNLPVHRDAKLEGMQHKYRETILFFPAQGQTCHAYCTFCFRWAQFVGVPELRFATREAELLVEYLRERPYVTDVLFTGGDPLVMSARMLGAYLEAALRVETVRTVRIGTKALAYWPQRVLGDPDAGELLALFRRVADSGRHLALMAHYTHPAELGTPEAIAAVAAVRATGAQILAQSPLLRGINDSAGIWARMWQRQVELGMIPYYMFIARDTGARRYFEVPLGRAWRVFRNAYNRVSGLARTVRGPSMSATPGKVRIAGVAEAGGERVFVLDFYQARNPDWVGRPFFAQYDPRATWLSDLKPAFGAREFFFERELRALLASDRGWEPDTLALPDPSPVGLF